MKFIKIDNSIIETTGISIVKSEYRGQYILGIYSNGNNDLNGHIFRKEYETSIERDNEFQRLEKLLIM